MIQQTKEKEVITNLIKNKKLKQKKRKKSKKKEKK